MKLLAIFSLSRQVIQNAIDSEARAGHPVVKRLEILEKADKVSIHGADSAVMAVIGRLSTAGHAGLLIVRPLSAQ